MAISVTTVSASVVYNASASFTGVRSVGGTGGLIDGGGNGYNDLLLSWSIVSLPNWSYQYTYTLQYREAPIVNRVIVDLSNECAIPSNPAKPSQACASSPAINGFPAIVLLGNWCGFGCSGDRNPGVPGLIGGLEFTGIPRATHSLTITFAAPGAPVWGDFYIAGGLQYVGNIGILNPLSTNALNFIAVPGAASAPAPEPATLGLAGAALILFGLLGNHRRR